MGGAVFYFHVLRHADQKTPKKRRAGQVAVPGEQTTWYSHIRNSLGCFYEESDATKCRETAQRNGNMQQSACSFQARKTDRKRPVSYADILAFPVAAQCFLK